MQVVLAASRAETSIGAKNLLSDSVAETNKKIDTANSSLAADMIRNLDVVCRDACGEGQ